MKTLTRKAIVTLLVIAAVFATLSCSSSKQPQALAPKTAQMNYEMALNYLNNNEPAMAIRTLTIAIEEDPKNADAHHLLGFILMGRKQYQEAEKHFLDALAVKPDMLNCKNNLGVNYLFLNQWANAARIFTELTKAPLYTSPWLAFANLGWANYKLGKIKTAIDNTEMALFLNPQMCLAANNLGIMYEELRQSSTAIKYLNDAANECKTYAEPHLHLAMIYSQQGNTGKALSHLKKCTDLSPRSDLGTRCREHINAIR